MISSERMDIGFYRYSLLNRGGDRMVVEYANHLVSSGHSVTFYLAEINTVFRLDSAIQISFVPWKGKIGFLMYGALHMLPHDFLVADIIHLPSLLSIRNRVVYFAQADDVEYYGTSAGRFLMNRLYRRFLRKGADVIAVEKSLSEAFANRYGYTDSCTVTNGIDLETFYADPDPDLIKIKGERRAVVFMARGDHYRKGYDLALQVFKTIDTATAEKMELWVCGSELSEDEFSFPVRNFGVISDDRLRKVLSSADIFFYPSRHEGFGLFPLEAMACGCVVVTTEALPYAKQIPCICTAQIGDVNGMHHYIAELIDQPDLLDRLRTNSIREARQFDVGRSKIEFEKVLRIICDKRSRK